MKLIFTQSTICGMYLSCFVEPSISRVVSAAAAVDHLVQHVGFVPFANLVALDVVSEDSVVAGGGQRVIHAD